MITEIQISDKALKDLRQIPKKQAVLIFEKIDALKPNLDGDVKHLTNYTPEYRLRVGEYRILFEIEENVITVYRVKHRKDAYR